MRTPKEIYTEGYFAGFEASWEGFNGEYPFGWSNLLIRDDVRLQEDLNDQYNSFIAQNTEAEQAPSTGCNYPLCKTETEQKEIAAEVHRQLYSGEPAPAVGNSALIDLLRETVEPINRAKYASCDEVMWKSYLRLIDRIKAAIAQAQHGE